MKDYKQALKHSVNILAAVLFSAVAFVFTANGLAYKSLPFISNHFMVLISVSAGLLSGFVSALGAAGLGALLGAFSSILKRFTISSRVFDSLNSSCEEIADCCEDALVSETEAEICSIPAMICFTESACSAEASAICSITTAVASVSSTILLSISAV